MSMADDYVMCAGCGHYKARGHAWCAECDRRERAAREQAAKPTRTPSGNSSSGSFSFLVAIPVALATMGYLLEVQRLEAEPAAIIGVVVGLLVGSLWKALLKLVVLGIIAFVAYQILMS